MKVTWGVVLIATGAAGAAYGPLVVAAPGAGDFDFEKEADAYYLGQVGSLHLFCGAEAVGLGETLLPYAGGRFYYRVEGVPPPALASFGEVLLADAGEVLLSRQYGFVYDEPMKALRGAWRRLVPARLPERKPTPPPSINLADGRIQYILSRIKAGDIEDDLAALTALPTRYSYSPYLDVAAELLYDRFASFGLSPRYDVFITAHDFDSCFFVPGTKRGWVVGASGLILRTGDGGSSWVVQKSGTDEELVDVFFYDATYGWIVGANGTVLQTADGGSSWRRLPKPTDRHLTGVHFESRNEGWACGTGGVILHTVDGGSSWEKQPSNMAETLFEIQFVDNLRGYAVGWHGEVRRTDDGGTTWVRRRTPFSDPQQPSEVVELTGLSFVSRDEGWVVGNHYDVIMHTKDGGVNWEVQRYDVAKGEYLGAVHFFDNKKGVAVGGEKGAVLRTADGGSSWRKIDAPADFPLTAVSFASAADGWACGYGSCVDYTGDGGARWVSLRDNLPEELGWYNVVCDVPGREEGDVQFLVVAHYDSISDEPRRCAPGADDNASGVVAALAVARVFAKAAFERTVRIVLFAGEEQGLVGSRDYARRAKARGDDIRGVWNMDMVGYVGRGPNDSTLFYKDDSSWMYSAAAQGRRLYVPELILGGENNAFKANSDHYSFWQKGYAAVLLTEDDSKGVYPHYHKVTDTPDHLSLPFIAMNARLAAATAAAWAGLMDKGPVLSLAAARVYPNPYKPSTSGAVGVTFDNVPSDASISIYDLAGAKVAAGAPDSGGAWAWRADVASGVYLYLLKRDGERRAGKVAVIK
ncbi:MAG: M20/M25/M40 family metallo-hydrolase [candidate division Zixibacteria bacterium]|nr:M20/M25/M40 family metallo-hydrolase [candidate division Zixibacteria bacterium]